MPTVTLYPSTITSVNYWSKADNAKVDDDTFAATSGTLNTAHDIKGSGFDTSGIPAGSIINSVVLVAEYKLSSTLGAWTGTLAAVKNGTEDTATAVTTTDEPKTATVWQNSSTGTYTLADLSTLAVLFRALKTSENPCTYYVDYLAITVDYTVPYNYNGTITAAVGDQSFLWGLVNLESADPTGTIAESAGAQSTQSGAKQSTNTVTGTIGDAETLTAGKSTAGSLTGTAGDQSTAEGRKNAANFLLDSLGEQSTDSAQKGSKQSILAMCGDDSILTGKKITLYAILDSLGQIAEISTSKGGLSDLAEAVGIDVVLSGNSLTVLRIYNPTKVAAVFDHTSQSKAVHDITAIEEVKVDY